MVEEEKAEHATETQVAEDLHDEAFEEAAKEGASASSETTPEETPAEEKKSDGKEKKAETSEKKTVEKPVESDEVKTLKQQLEETKRWGTGNAEKVAELTRRLETAEKKPEATVEEEVPEDVKTFYDDYPEFKKAVDFETDRKIKALGLTGSVTSATIEEVKSMAGQIAFNQVLISGLEDDKGEFIEGHQDGLKVARSKEFKEWAKTDPDRETSDPIRAIKLISRFKESKVKQAVKEHDENLEKEADERKKAASAAIHSTKGGSRSSGKAGKDDFDSAFDEAAAS